MMKRNLQIIICNSSSRPGRDRIGGQTVLRHANRPARRANRPCLGSQADCSVHARKQTLSMLAKRFCLGPKTGPVRVHRKALFRLANRLHSGPCTDSFQTFTNKLCTSCKHCKTFRPNLPAAGGKLGRKVLQCLHLVYVVLNACQQRYSVLAW